MSFHKKALNAKFYHFAVFTKITTYMKEYSINASLADEKNISPTKAKIMMKFDILG